MGPAATATDETPMYPHVRQLTTRRRQLAHEPEPPKPPNQPRKEHTMHGPPLTPQEGAASVARRVSRLEAAGLDRDHAIRRVAAENGIEPEKVRWCAEIAPGGSSARPSDDHPRLRSERPNRAIKPNHVRPTPGSRRRRPLAPLALVAAALVAGLLALASPAGAAANTIDVNPATGSDTNSEPPPNRSRRSPGRSSSPAPATPSSSPAAASRSTSPVTPPSATSP
jgi:hypothetical protein